MSETVLNDLDQLPHSCIVSILGGLERNVRFEKALRSLRPDISIHSKVAIPLTYLTDSEILQNQELPLKLSQVDFVLITSCKLRHYNELLARFKAVPARLLVVNPNFYHPFVQFGLQNYDDHAHKLMAAQRLLSFEEDRQIYELVLKAIRPKKDLREVYARLMELCGQMERQYFDHINAAAIRTIIEGGTADGWNAVQFIASFPMSVIYGFEPDFGLFDSSYYKAFLMSTGRFHISKLGLWQKADRLHFKYDKAYTSKVSKGINGDGDGYLETISIDEFVFDSKLPKVDFIKLDIEGSELHALKGARETIAKHRPQIAVCIYHLLSHYYEIPLLLSTCAKDYIFRIGHYSPFHVFSETVLYAIPQELYLYPQECQ